MFIDFDWLRKTVLVESRNRVMKQSGGNRGGRLNVGASSCLKITTGKFLMVWHAMPHSHGHGCVTMKVGNDG